MAEWLIKYKVIRTAALAFTLWLTWEVYDFVMSAIASKLITHEWMVASLLSPISLLQGAVFKFFADKEL